MGKLLKKLFDVLAAMQDAVNLDRAFVGEVEDDMAGSRNRVTA